MSFDTCAVAYDSTLQVFTGSSLETLEVVAEDDGGCGLGSRVSFAAEPGTTYSIRVGGFSTSSGAFQLAWSSNTAPDCSTVVASKSSLRASGKRLQQVSGARITP